MNKMIISALALMLTNSAFAAPVIEEDQEICGALAYTNGHYLLMSDHDDNYHVREKKLARSSFKQTTLMRIIVMNHDYNSPDDYPQACFYNVKSERLEGHELDVLELSDVQSRKFLL